MKNFRLFFIITVILISVSAHAEYYRYVGKDGKVHYTDEYSNVPDDQRPEDVKAYRETPRSEDLMPTADGELGKPATATDVSGSEPKKLKGREEELTALNKRYSELKQVKEQLDTEYNTLTKERAELEKQRKTLKTKEDIEQFNSKIKSLTEKTNTYEKKTKKYTIDQAEYNIDIQAFNAKVQQDLKKRISTYEAGEEQEQEQTGSPYETESRDIIKIDATANIDVQRRTLMKHKAEIEKEYNNLTKEKELLAEEKKNLKTKAEVDDYMRKKEDLNQKIAVFQKKQQVFDKEVLDFNTRQEQENSKAAQTAQQPPESGTPTE